MTIKNLYCLLLAIPVFLVGEVAEISRLEEVLSYLNPSCPQETLILFDIDNTLIRPKQQLGSDVWSDRFVDDLMSKGISDTEADFVGYVLWKAVHSQIDMQMVDPKAPQVIREIQNREISLLYLTARWPEESAYTCAQLYRAGIPLLPQPWGESEQELFSEPCAIYERGIIFCSWFNKKSKVLLAFLEKNHLQPKYVIFIDDKAKHVRDVSKALIDRGITCIGLRFSGADPHVQAFDPKVADLQWKAFPHLLSDEEALSLLE